MIPLSWDESGPRGATEFLVGTVAPAQTTFSLRAKNDVFGSACKSVIEECRLMDTFVGLEDQDRSMVNLVAIFGQPS